jgi:hypothetical protein
MGGGMSRSYLVPPLVRILVFAVVVSLALCACAGGMTADGGDASFDDSSLTGTVPGDDAPPGDDAAGPSSDGSTGPAPDGGARPPPEGGPQSPMGPPFDAGEGGVCNMPLTSGDLVIDELMIESVAGTGDYGQWIEVRSTLGCAVDLRGLHGECPSGKKVATFDVTEDLWIPAFGTFLVVDSSDPAINHDLPGTLVVWSGGPGDVLRRKGTTITIESGGVLVDTVTYPAFKLLVGVSVSFPSDCPDSVRSDWTEWQTSTFSWFPGFFGTPNAANDDVSCP